MMKKAFFITAFILFILVTACNRNENTTNQSNNESDSSYSEAFFEKRDKVIFDFYPEVPDPFDASSFPEVTVTGLQFSDSDEALHILGDGREIQDTEIIPASEYRPDEYVSYFTDESSLSAGGSSVCFYTDNFFKRFSSVFNYLSLNLPLYSDITSNLSFETADDCMSNFISLVNDIGYETEPSGIIYSVTSEQMEVWIQYLESDEGRSQKYWIDDENMINWTDDDNVYVISAYQSYNMIPVYPKMLVLNQDMSLDLPRNMPIQAIYSSNGLEYLLVMYQYSFEHTGSTQKLLPLSRIIDTVDARLNNTLPDVYYEVYRAKLFLMVSYNGQQQYEATPIWYFEVQQKENHDESMVILVDAITGIEIPI